MQKSHVYLNYIKIDIKIEIKNMLTSSLQHGKLIKTYETGEGEEVAFETAFKRAADGVIAVSKPLVNGLRRAT